MPERTAAAALLALHDKLYELIEHNRSARSGYRQKLLFLAYGTLSSEHHDPTNVHGQS